MVRQGAQQRTITRRHLAKAEISRPRVRVPEVVDKCRRLFVTTNSLADGLAHEMRSGDPVGSAVVPIMINGPHGAINNKGGATESVIVFQFAVRKQPDMHGLPNWGGGAQTFGPDIMNRRADAIVVLSVQGVGSLIIQAA